MKLLAYDRLWWEDGCAIGIISAEVSNAFPKPESSDRAAQYSSLTAVPASKDEEESLGPPPNCRKNEALKPV